MNAIHHQDAERPGGARAILRVVNVLTELAAVPKGMTLTALSVRLDVPKASLARLLQTLKAADYVEQAGGMFRLGGASHALGRMIGDAAPAASFPDSAQPILDWLAAQTGETVMLAELTPQGDAVVYVAVVESSRPIRFSLQVGDMRPLHAAAAGQAVLAFASEQRHRDYMASADFAPFTPHSCTADQLPARLEVIRKSALAFDADGVVEGATGIAGPVFDREGAVRFAISVAGPSDRIAADRTEIGALVKRAGERISRILGYGGDYSA